jgi:hypothetical protein
VRACVCMCVRACAHVRVHAYRQIHTAVETSNLSIAELHSRQIEWVGGVCGAQTHAHVHVMATTGVSGIKNCKDLVSCWFARLELTKIPHLSQQIEGPQRS